MCYFTREQIKGFVSLCFDEILDLFKKFDIDRYSIDISGRTDAMFNAAFIKALLKHFDILEYFNNRKQAFFKIDLSVDSIGVNDDFKKE